MPKGATVLEIELRNAGWPKTVAEFRAWVLAEYGPFVARHASPAMRPEDFMLRPVLAQNFADLVRFKLRSEALQDHTILGSLVGRVA